MRRLGRCGERLSEFGIELLGHDQKPGAAILKHEAVIVFGQKRVDWHRHHAGLDGAEKSGGPVDGVEETQEHALLAAKPERAKHVTESVRRGRRGRHRSNLDVLNLGDDR